MDYFVGALRKSTLTRSPRELRQKSRPFASTGAVQDLPYSAVQYVRHTLGMQVCTVAQLSDLLAFLARQNQPDLQAHLGPVQVYRDRYGV